MRSLCPRAAHSHRFEHVFAAQADVESFCRLERQPSVAPTRIIRARRRASAMHTTAQVCRLRAAKAVWMGVHDWTYRRRVASELTFAHASLRTIRAESDDAQSAAPWCLASCCDAQRGWADSALHRLILRIPPSCPNFDLLNGRAQRCISQPYSTQPATWALSRPFARLAHQSSPTYVATVARMIFVYFWAGSTSKGSGCLEAR